MTKNKMDLNKNNNCLNNKKDICNASLNRSEDSLND